MKLLMENWRQFLAEQNYKGPPLNYSSVVLKDPNVMVKALDRLGIREQVPPEFAVKPGKWPHHMTINMGPLLDGWVNDQPVSLTIDGWGIVNGEDEKGKKLQAMAFRVNRENMAGQVKNAVPHITTLVGPDGKAHQSNKIPDDAWVTLDNPFDVEGIVVDATQQQKKKKKPQQQKKKGPNIRAMAMGMSRGGKSLEEISAQIEKTTGKKISADNIGRMIGKI
tara:strand:+ start:229 stop:894 length:666 start_codon:yes stop_codon:yes gene_type:complete